MRALVIARRTASAVASIWACRPTSSGANAGVKATPIAKVLVPVVGAGARRTSNTIQCGDSPPSVPPDITKATRFSTASGVSPSRAAIADLSADVA